ncbi:MAG: hypothetical protein PHR64_01140 [Candidatus Shapirobacteria bacterium]|nr:hypothetical protein [Candidatus Shapirobacteria bacterium]MDD5074018.1 hypothetical protein [Candidatus Shapirobacteria bacterium]MDD5481538.1 hypothetical protein [Candidatus Shapirobacteria bacterium]
MAQKENQEINFLASDQVGKMRAQEELVSAAKKAGLILLVWLLALSAVLGYGLVLSNKNKSLKGESVKLEQQLTQLNDKITLVLILKDRLGKIDQIFKNQNDLSEPLGNFFTSLPNGIALTKVSLTSKTLDVTGTGDILSISYLTKAYTGRSQGWYQGAILKSLVKNEKDVNFTFSLVVEL